MLPIVLMMLGGCYVLSGEPHYIRDKDTSPSLRREIWLQPFWGFLLSFVATPQALVHAGMCLLAAVEKSFADIRSPMAPASL